MEIDENIAEQKSYDLALKIVLLYKEHIRKHKEFVLSKQLLRAGTSVGANVTEARGGISSADFSAKISIAYKESRETKFWLRLLRDADFLEEKKSRNYITKPMK